MSNQFKKSLIKIIPNLYKKNFLTRNMCDSVNKKNILQYDHLEVVLSGMVFSSTILWAYFVVNDT